MSHRHFGIHQSSFAPVPTARNVTAAPSPTASPAAAVTQFKNVRRPLGGIEQVGARQRDAIMPRYSNSFPRGSLVDPGSHSLESLDHSHSMRDLIAIGVAVFFGSSAGIAVGIALFICFFVEFH